MCKDDETSKDVELATKLIKEACSSGMPAFNW